MQEFFTLAPWHEGDVRCHTPFVRWRANKKKGRLRGPSGGGDGAGVAPAAHYFQTRNLSIVRSPVPSTGSTPSSTLTQYSLPSAQGVPDLSFCVVR
jgi:hypothetical protein